MRLLWGRGAPPRWWSVRAAPCSLSPQELGLLQDYLLALTTDDHLLRCAAQVLSHLGAGPWWLPAGGGPSPSLWPGKDPLCLWHEYRSPPPPPPPRPGFTRNSVPVQSLAAGVRGSGRAPFVTVIHTKLRGQKTLARLCVC